MIQGQKQDLFQTNAERFRPNDPEAVGLGERSTQEPELSVHPSRISSPINRNIPPLRLNIMLLHLRVTLTVIQCVYKCTNLLSKLKKSLQNSKQAMRG
ncbi:hypothetical protein O181_060867 [Austropuccinia psidii MF-1]|uniref:Uncharacterized protein n=1 Tax=Austropuccinia psidii MF-1 TaxID=1389203 RepID=A0A9Q3EJI1_9BASI|nr:hypothetical protein [Austropuccinia psidii MF-1]